MKSLGLTFQAAEIARGVCPQVIQDGRFIPKEPPSKKGRDIEKFGLYDAFAFWISYSNFDISHNLHSAITLTDTLQKTPKKTNAWPQVAGGYNAAFPAIKRMPTTAQWRNKPTAAPYSTLSTPSRTSQSRRVRCPYTTYMNTPHTPVD